jgi:hypothetical protein
MFAFELLAILSTKKEAYSNVILWINNESFYKFNIK